MTLPNPSRRCSTCPSTWCASLTTPCMPAHGSRARRRGTRKTSIWLAERHEAREHAEHGETRGYEGHGLDGKRAKGVFGVSLVTSHWSYGVAAWTEPIALRFRYRSCRTNPLPRLDWDSLVWSTCTIRPIRRPWIEKDTLLLRFHLASFLFLHRVPDVGGTQLTLVVQSPTHCLFSYAM